MATIENIWDEVVNLNAKLDALPGLIEISGNQVKVITLDELSESLGLIKAGELRVGNGSVPGDGFSGVRIGFPPLRYPPTDTADSSLYNIVGVDADTLQFGLRASDGTAVAGAGDVIIDNLGITLAGGAGQTNQIKWLDTNIGEDTLAQAYVAEISARNSAAPDTVMWASLELQSEAFMDTDIGSPTSSDITQTLLTFEASAYGNIHSAESSNVTLTEINLFAKGDTSQLASGFSVRHKLGLDDGATTDAHTVNQWIMRMSSEAGVNELRFAEDAGGIDSTYPMDLTIYSNDSAYVHFQSTDQIVLFGATDTTNNWLELSSDGIFGGSISLLWNERAADTTHMYASTNIVRVGIGSTAPAGGLHLLEAAAGNVLTYNSSGDNFIIESNTHMGMQFMGPVDRDQSIWFADSDSIESGGITYSHQDDRFEIRVATAISGIWESSGLAFGNFAPDGEIHIDSAMAFTGIPTTPPSTPDTEVVKVWADTAGELRLTDSDGEDWYVTKSTSTGHGPILHAEGQGDSTQVLSSGATTSITLLTEIVDDDSMIDTAGANPERITVQTAGTYIVMGRLTLRPPTDLGGRQLWRIKHTDSDGTDPFLARLEYPIIDTTSFPAFSGTGFTRAAVGDYFTMEYFSNNAEAITLANSTGTFLKAVRISS